MNLTPRILLLALAMCTLTGPGTLAQEDQEDEIYICRDANGEITALQVDPCPEPPKAAPQPKPAPRPVTRKPAVRKKKPAARPKSKPNPRPTGWQLVPRVPHRPSPARPKLRGQSFPTRLTGPAPLPGPAFSTPELTWRTFLAATEAGDRSAAAACFTPEAIANLGPDPESFPLDDLRVLVASFTRIENEGSVGPYWSIYGVRAAARPKWILFEEMPDGEWKISGM